ncbi:MAG: hypothetical protein ACR2QF_02780 [Geminicoccaceae bacterium]
MNPRFDPAIQRLPPAEPFFAVTNMHNERAELFETYRSLFRSIVAATSFFLTANLTVIGIAANNKSAFLILIAGLFPLTLMMAYFLFSKIYCSLFFSAMHSDLKNEQNGKLFFSVALSIVNSDLYKKFEEIVKMDSFEMQTQELQKMQNKFTPPFSIAILSLVTLLHIIASIVCWRFVGWPLV